MTPLGIKPTTSWLVAQWLNQLCCVFHKDLVLSIITGQVTGLPSQYKTVNHSYNTLSNCANFSCFNVCHLKRPFTLLLDAMNNQNWSFNFFMSWAVDDPILYEAITFLQFSPHFKLFKVSEQSLKLSVSSCQQHAVYSFLDLFKPL